MYSSEQTRHLQDLSKSLLLRAARQPMGEKELAPLRQVLVFHEYRYYILNDPLITDPEYDSLFKWLEKLESAHPDHITPDSPTHRVAKGLTKNFPAVHHLVPMLSLENSYNADDLVDWDRKARELTGLASLEYCVEPKFDG
ncbi:MAG: DNA ligase (NAD(+)) LigA, partial [Puia sp.]